MTGCIARSQVFCAENDYDATDAMNFVQGIGSSAAPMREKIIEFLLWMAGHSADDNQVLINGDPRRVSHEIFDAAKKWLWKSLNQQLSAPSVRGDTMPKGYVARLSGIEEASRVVDGRHRLHRNHEILNYECLHGLQTTHSLPDGSYERYGHG